jgi:hypothetical protein
MNPVSLSLDLLLVVLLIAALGFCWRLERRLKGLRDSHADFAHAVADLDRAAQRAETGLAQLRQATDETVDLLASRIEKARELAAKLEQATAEAATPRPRAANDPIRSMPERAAPRPTPQRAAPERSWSRPAVAAPVDAVLAAESLARRLSDDESLVLRERAPAAARAVQQHPAQRPAAPTQRPAAPQRPARVRSSFDDDLFEAPALAMGGQARSR